jgi:hypothetical protein
MPPDELHCVSLLTGYMINGDFDGEVPSIMGHSRLYPSKPTPRALPSNLKRNLDRQADYHAKVRDLYDLAVEFEIVKNRVQFDNPTESQTSKIAEQEAEARDKIWRENFCPHGVILTERRMGEPKGVVPAAPAVASAARASDWAAEGGGVGL